MCCTLDELDAATLPADSPLSRRKTAASVGRRCSPLAGQLRSGEPDAPRLATDRPLLGQLWMLFLPALQLRIFWTLGLC